MSKIVFTNGVFDTIHPSHFNLLLYCRKLAGDCGEVIVALDSDEKVKNDKGQNRPIFSFKERNDALLSLCDDAYYFDGPIVNKIYQFNTNEELYELIKTCKPNIIVKGTDWKDNVVGSDLAKVEHFVIYPKFSTTKIIDRCLLSKKCYCCRDTCDAFCRCTDAEKRNTKSKI